MRKDLGVVPAVLPMPVLMVAASTVIPMDPATVRTIQSNAIHLQSVFMVFRLLRDLLI